MLRCRRGRDHIPKPSGNNHILTQNLYYNYYYPKFQVPNSLVLGPLGFEDSEALDVQDAAALDVLSFDSN